MSNRLAAGFTVAGFPLTAAFLAIADGNFCRASALGLAFALTAALTLAPKLPILQGLPPFGAPHLTAGFKATGSVEFHAPLKSARR